MSWVIRVLKKQIYSGSEGCERTLIFLNEYNVPTKEKLFHDILERIVQGAVNEMVVLITRARAWHVAAGLQKKFDQQQGKNKYDVCC